MNGEYEIVAIYSGIKKSLLTPNSKNADIQKKNTKKYGSCY